MSTKKKLLKLEWGVIILTGLLPFSFALNPTESIDLSIIRPLIVLIFAFWLIAGLLNKNIFLDKRLRFWLLLFIFSIATISLSWSINQEKAFRKILFLGSIFPIYLVYYSFLKTKKNNFLLFFKTIFWGAFVSALLGIIQFFLQFVIGIDSLISIQSKLIPFFLGNNFSELVLEYNSWLVNVNGITLFRSISLFPDPHLFSLFLNISLVIAIFLWKNKSQSIYLMGIVFILTASLLTFSRAGYLSLIMAFCFFWLRFLTKKNIWNILIVLSFMLLILIPNPVNQRFFSILNFKDGSVSERISLWKTSIKITQENLWRGVGIGNLSESIKPFSKTRTPIYAHNLFLDFSSEIGLLGGLAIFLMLISPIKDFYQLKSFKNFCLATIFIVIIIHSMFETPFYSVSLLPLILGLLAI